VTVIAAEPVELGQPEAQSAAPAAGVLASLHRRAPTIVYAGVGLVVAGFALITFGWSRVAGIDSVPMQVPYLLSAGMIGLGVVLVGLTAVNLGALYAAEAERARQLERLANLVETMNRDRASER
jgi:hypothetical protein